VTFLLSDFEDQGYEQQLRIAARRHDLTAVVVLDRRELELPRVGLIALEDAETGARRILDTNDRRSLVMLERANREVREQRQALFRAAGVGQLEILTDRPYLDDIVRFFRSRERRR
jgi:hypothetical protein